MGFAPTAQQAQIRDTARDGENLIIEAGAGSGKTSTLRLLGADRPNLSGLYVAYNKAIQLDADGSFTPNVACRTAHSLAWKGTVGRYGDRVRKARMGSLPVRDVQDFLRLRNGLDFGSGSDADVIEARTLAEMVARAVGKFCNSADTEITGAHTVRVPGLGDAESGQLAEVVAQLAGEVWADFVSGRGGKLTFTPDVYLKLWQLSRPTLRQDVIMFDEAQDANPVVASVVERQVHAQLIAVGDRNQALYEWRGATDAMSRWGWERLWLTQSFRFGPAIADRANLWLEYLNADLRLEGFERVDSRIGPLSAPDAVLCRTNIGVVDAALRQLAAGRRVSVVGGVGEAMRLARAAVNLRNGRRAGHPDLAAFRDWSQFLDFVANDPDGEPYRVLVAMITLFGPEEILSLGDRLCAREANADVAISTCHKCVHPDTLVETPAGLLPIHAIPDDGEIGTPTGARTYCGKFTRMDGPIVALGTKRGYEVKVSPDHGMTVWRGDGYQRVEARDLRPGDWLRLRIGATIDPVAMPRLPLPGPLNARARRWDIPDVMSVELAELLGLLVADGTIFATGKGVRVVKWHADVVVRFAILVKELFGYEVSIGSHAGTPCGVVHSVHICRWLESLGGLSPHAKAVPSVIMASPLTIHAAFLRGLFEDGTVNMRGENVDHIHWDNKDPALAAVVQTMLLRLGIAATRKTHHGRATLYLYSEHAERFAADIGFIASWKNTRLTRRFGRDLHSLIPLNRQELAPLEAGLSVTDKQNARLNGYVTTAVARKVVAVLGSNRSGVLPARLGWLHERVARIDEGRGVTMCVTVRDGSRFLQNGFDGWNSKGREWPTVQIAADFAPRESDSEDDDTPRFSRPAAMLAYVAITRAQHVLDPGPLVDAP